MLSGGRMLAAVLGGAVLGGAIWLAASATAQAPERSPLPLPRPAQVATVASDTSTRRETAPTRAATTGTIAGLSVESTGALRRAPPPAPRPSFDSVQLPNSMLPQRPVTEPAVPQAPATDQTLVIAAIIPDTTPYETPNTLAPAPAATAPIATGPRPIRPSPRPQGPRAALPQTPIPDTSGPGVELPPAPGLQQAASGLQQAAPGLQQAAPGAQAALAEIAGHPESAANPLAPPRSLRPLRRSPAALSRHTQATRHAAQITPAAAGGSGTGRVSGGLCGVSTLEGRPLPRIASATSGCGITEPVSITAVGGIRLSQPATLDCDTARAFDRWVRQVMQPAIGRGGGGVTQIRIAAHYTCRPRNNRPGARVSEHGRGRAIDIAGFRLADGQSVTVLQDWRLGPHSQALRQMHASACGIFRTTLGPGSDGHHEDHFHFDLAQHRNGGTYCR